MLLYDGKIAVNLEMREWEDGSGYGDDFSYDFFDAGDLERVKLDPPICGESDVYLVDSVEYCVGMARDARDHTGDFTDDSEYYPASDGVMGVFEFSTAGDGLTNIRRNVDDYMARSMTGSSEPKN